MNLTKLVVPEVEGVLQEDLQNPSLQGMVLTMLLFVADSSIEDVPPEILSACHIVQVYPTGVTLISVPSDQVQAINDLPCIDKFQIVTNNYVPCQ